MTIQSVNGHRENVTLDSGWNVVDNDNALSTDSLCMTAVCVCVMRACVYTRVGFCMRMDVSVHHICM